MSNFLYVDNSNVWIEGMYVSAVAGRLATSVQHAHDNGITDQGYRMDLGRLLNFAGGEQHQIGRAVLFGSSPPSNDSLWEVARSRGFEVIVHERSVWTGREKRVDVHMATEIVTDSFTRIMAGHDEITIVSGDSDFVPTVKSLLDRGFCVDVCFWDHAARELRDVATGFISLNAFLDFLRLK